MAVVDIEERLKEMIRGLETEMLEKTFGIPQGPPGPPTSPAQMVADWEWTLREPTVLVFMLYGEAMKMMPKSTVVLQHLPEWQQELHKKAGKKITRQIFVRDDDEADILAGFKEKGISYELHPNVRRQERGK